jgi:hypothetical protein
MGINAATMSAFMRGERPLPPFRQIALIALVTALLEGIGSPATLPSTKHASRAQAVRRSVEHWLELAIAELGTPSQEAQEMGAALASSMFAKLEAQ